MPKNKKGVKERQHDRQTKQQRSAAAQQKRIETKIKKNSRQLSKKKIFLAISLIVIILGVILVWQFSTEHSLTIYIRSDGTIDPSSANITNLDNSHYTFTADIFGSIVNERDNIVIDGANYILQGENETNSTGIDLSERNNVTITNLKIEDFEHGILIESGTNIVLSKNDLTNENSIGFVSSFNITVIGNNITNSYRAIMLAQSANNTITKNNLDDNNYGINLYYGSLNNTISENIITNCTYAIMSASSNSTITKNNLDNNNYGINLYYGSSNNAISENIIINNDYAIFLTSSDNNSFSENNLQKNNQGIILEQSFYNSIVGNTITDCEGAIGLTDSSNNQITKNNIVDNEFGVDLNASSDNSFFHNSFINNTYQALTLYSFNTWNNENGTPLLSSGNFWSDYEEKYPDAEKVDQSRIWSTPYNIDANNEDNFPLVNHEN
jgi:parallel beta-helix repeat protein